MQAACKRGQDARRELAGIVVVLGCVGPAVPLVGKGRGASRTSWGRLNYLLGFRPAAAPKRGIAFVLILTQVGWESYGDSITFFRIKIPVPETTPGGARARTPAALTLTRPLAPPCKSLISVATAGAVAT
jgi:hypothetical protein